MRQLQEYLSEDSNQYGPGTDLIISLLAVLLVIIFINSNLYRWEKDKNNRLVKERNDQLAKGGSFKPAARSFDAADFKPKPYRDFGDRERALVKVKEIVQDYKRSKSEYPHIFVIGHASRKDDPDALDKSEAARLSRNWGYAGERAALISSLLQEFLTPEEKNRMVVVSTGEFDLKARDPEAQENAWVEVFFGKEWKPPLRGSAK